jgi:hypothetical protein
MNTWICGCQHPVGRACLYCIAADPAPRPARRRVGRRRLAIRGRLGAFGHSTVVATA